MNVFSQKEKVEEKSYGSFYEKDKRKEEKEGENANAAAEEIAADSDHQLTKLLKNPYWIKEAIESAGEKLDKSFQRNFKRACAIVAREEGYDEDLIKAVFEIIKKEETKEKWEERKIIH